MILVSLSVLFTLGSTQYVTADTTPRLFPAAKQEQYDPQTHSLRTLQRIDQLSFHHHYHHNGVRSLQDDLKEDPVIVAARQRFLDYITNAIPDHANEYSINPQQQTLVPIAEVHLIVMDNTTTNHSRGSSHTMTTPHVPANVDESYQLHIDSTDGSSIVVQAKTVFGIVRALESLAQLLEFGWMDTLPNTKKTDTYPDHVIRNTPIFVADAPTYSYRGLMIDTSRHYLPLSLILENLNVMAMNKLNVLHWHMTDAQSWPFQSTTYPELSTKGAWSFHQIYTHENVRQVIREAYLRGIRVIPEFDLPGHSQVLERSHPELMSQCDERGPNDFSAPLDPTLPIVYDFVENLYQEVATLFPDSFVHIGGDEVNMDCWNHDDKVMKWAKSHGMTKANELLNYFESILTDIASSCNKTPIVWQELINEGVDLPPETIIDVWKGFDTKTIEDATRRNYTVIVSGCWYLDHLGDRWDTYYKCELLNFNGTQVQKDLIMGGHASMWGERVDASNFMERVWPRASAVAEKLWSGSEPQAYRDILSKTVNRRITAFRCLMVLRGVAAAPISPGVCQQDPRFPPSHPGATGEPLMVADRIRHDSLVVE